MAKRTPKKVARTPKKIRASSAARAAQKHVGSVHLRFIRLVDSVTKIIVSNGESPTEVKIELKAGHAIREDGDLHVIGVHVNATVVGLPPGLAELDDKKSHLMITAHFECQYGSPVPLDDEGLKILDGIGINVAWPLAREFILDMSARMGMPPILLPLVTIDQTTKQPVFLQPLATPN